MLNAKYHREQAMILAGLALSTPDARAADRFSLAAMEHLVEAQAGEHADSPLSDLPAADIG